MLKNTELMPFIKFTQARGVIVCNEKKNICGVFRDKITRKVHKGDNFEAQVIGKGTAEETYKMYLKWNNHVRYTNKNEREFVNAKWE